MADDTARDGQQGNGRRDAAWEADLRARRQARRKKAGPRPGWKRPRRILSLWSRLALLVAVIVVSVFIAVGIVTKAIRPYHEARVQTSQLARTRQASAALLAENADLARHIAYLKTPDGVASEARRMGYLRPGELPIVVTGLDGGGGDAAPASSPLAAPAPVSVSSPVPEQGGAARRFWRHLIGH